MIDRDEYLAQLNRARVKKCEEKTGHIMVRVGKDIVETLKEKGYAPATYAKEALLERMKTDGLIE